MQSLYIIIALILVFILYKCMNSHEKYLLNPSILNPYRTSSNYYMNNLYSDGLQYTPPIISVEPQVRNINRETCPLCSGRRIGPYDIGVYGG